MALTEWSFVGRFRSLDASYLIADNVAAEHPKMPLKVPYPTSAEKRAT